ncbi:MAG: NAD(P)H-binding protein, partial [Steroidobacteraceae bacterium]
MTHAEPVVPLRAAAPLSICVLGGSGFVGSELVASLAAARHRIRVLTRHAASAQHLLVLPTVEVVVADIHNPPALARQFTGIDVVVNLVGILNERGRDGSGFRRAHTELARKIVTAARAARVGRILQMSALGADARHGPSHYLQTKGAAEEAIRTGALDVEFVIFRPSVIFGPGDGFTNRFAQLLRLAGGVLPLPGARTRFAPVYVGD